MLSPITAIIKSFVFSVLNTFFGDTNKKEDGMERIEGSANSRGSAF